MDTFELIRQTGLSKKEAAVYTSLLEDGQQSISSLNRNTHINRPALYDLLPRLERRGLISRVKQKSRFQYAAESPQRLLDAHIEKQKNLNKDLQTLVDTYEKQSSMRPTIKYFEGEHGLKFVFDDVVRTIPCGSEFLRYSARVSELSEKFDDTFYAKERDRKHIERLVITSEKKALAKETKLDRAVRAIPKEFDLFEDDISLLIYGDKTAYVDYGSKTAFIVESEKIAHFQEKLFRLLWKFLRT